jgi:hypothetical protein
VHAIRLDFTAGDTGVVMLVGPWDVPGLCAADDELAGASLADADVAEAHTVFRVIADEAFIVEPVAPGV